MIPDSSAEPLFPLNPTDANLRTIVDAMTDAVVIVDHGGRVRFANLAAERMFGRETREFFAQPFGYPVIADLPAELDIVRPDGGVAVAEMRAVEISWEGFPAFLAALRDVTGRRENERVANEVRTKLEKHVAERTLELRAANAELKSFTASIAHDLRGPLQGVIGFSELLLEDCAEMLDEGRLDQLRMIRTAAWRMTELIDQLLSLASVTRQEIEREPVRLDVIAEEVISDLRRHQSDREVKTMVRKGMEERADPRLVRLVLENLIGNAWKYTARAEHPLIAFGSRAETDGSTLYYIHDNGVGFDPSQVKNLFKPFRRLHAEADFPGVGIGLAVVHRIVRRHGGKIWADAVPGDGATFYFTLAPGPGAAL